MGNSRNKLDNAMKKELAKKKNQTAESSHRFNIAMISIAAVLCIAIVAVVVVLLVSSYKDTVATPEETVPFKSEHFEVDNAMVTYMYTTTFYNYYSSNYSTMTAQNFDPTQPLSSQYISQDGQTTTWHNYILSLTANNIAQTLLLAEAATDEGKTLNDDDKALIDEAIAAINTDAESSGRTPDEYLARFYGEDVTVDAIRRMLEISALANKQTEDLKESFNITTADCEAYYDENRDDYDRVDFRSYDVDAVDDDEIELTEEEKAAAYAQAEATANEIAKATSEDEFVQLVFESILAGNDKLQTPITEETAMANAKDTKATDFTRTGGGVMDQWLFDTERKVGDTTVINSTDGVYTVYYMTRVAHRDEDPTRTVRHILIKNASTEDQKEEVAARVAELQAAWDASDKTVEAFEKLADEYNEDSASLYENFKEGAMITEFNDWCFDPARKEGDCEMVETYYGSHLIYFVGEGIPTWESDVREILINNKYGEALTSYESKYDISFDQNKLLKIKDYNYYQAPAETETTSLETVNGKDTTADTSEAAVTEPISADTAQDTVSEPVDTAA